VTGELEDLDQEYIASPARRPRLPASLERRLAAIEKRLDLRVPETRFGLLERVLAGSSSDDFMLLLAV
jgi:hypothetical protein